MTSDPARAPARSHGLRGLLALTAFYATVSAAVAAWRGERGIVATSIVLAGASLARLFADPPPSTCRRWVHGVTSLLTRATPLAAALAASVGGAEAGARWIYRDITTTANFRGYFSSRWLSTQVRDNHYGYRGAEFDEEKAAGVFRVAVLGDSFTWGNGVPEAQRFSNLVGEALADRGVEVLNLGFPGNNWPEHVRTLERRVLRLRPDFVLLQWGVNDVELDRDARRRPSVAHPVADPARHEWLLAHSALYVLLDGQWARLRVWGPRYESYDAYMVRLYADPASEGAVQAATLMRRFIDRCRAKGVGVGLVLVPDAAVSLGADYPYRFLHDRVDAICRDTGVPCLDLLPDFSRVDDRFQLWVSPLDSHPSVLANRLIADRVLSTFAPSWRSVPAPAPTDARPTTPRRPRKLSTTPPYRRTR